MGKHRRIVFTTLGEIVADNVVIGGNCNVRNAAETVLTPREMKRWLRLRGPEIPELKRKVDAAIEQFFRDEEARVLSPYELKILQHVSRLQVLNNAKFRIYGGVETDGQGWAKMVIEFVAFVNDKAAWKAIRSKMREVGAEYGWQHTDKHLDKYAPPKGTKDEKVLKSTTLSDGTRIHWATGPNHGRPETQIEYKWDVMTWSLAKTRRQMKVFARRTKDVFDKYGVGVI